jgi:hypothetical protein
MNATCHTQQCICPKLHTTIRGLTCNETIKLSKADMGWPLDGCTGKPLFSKDLAGPQWMRTTRLSQEDELKVFFPFKNTKIPIVKDLKIVFEAPLMTTAKNHMGSSSLFSVGCYAQLYQWVLRATLLMGFNEDYSTNTKAAKATKDAASKAASGAGFIAGKKHSAATGLGKAISALGLAIRFDMPRGLRISDLMPFLKHKDKCKEVFIDKLRLSKIAVYLAVADLTDHGLSLLPGDPYTGVEVKRGVTYLAELELGNIKLLGGLGKIFGGTRFQVSVGASPFGSFNIGFGIATTLPKPFTALSGKVSFDITSPTEPDAILNPFKAGIRFRAMLRLGFDLGSSKVAFQGVFTIALKGAPFNPAGGPPQMPVRFDADMLGCVKNPFKISGLEICDVGIGFGIDGVALASGPGMWWKAFNYLRLQGAVVLGEGESQQKIILYLRLDLSDPFKNALLGVMKGPLGLVDLLNIPIHMARKARIPIPTIPKAPFPILELKDLMVKVAMEDLYIAGEQFRMGVNLQFNMTILGIRWEVDCLVDAIFVKIKSTIERFNFAGLKLTGNGCDMIPGNADDGVCLWIELGVKPWRAKFQFTGIFSALGLFTIGGHVEISNRGFYLGFVYQFGIFKSDVAIWSNNMDELIEGPNKGRVGDEELLQADGKNDLNTPKYKNDLHFRATMRNEVFDWLAKQIDSGVEKFKKIMDAAISKANNEIGAAAKKVRECGGLNKEEEEQEQQEDVQMSDEERRQIVDDSIRRIRRFVLPAEQMLLIDDSAPIEMPVTELQELVRRADEKEAACDAGDLPAGECVSAYDFYNDMSDPRDAAESEEDLEDAMAEGETNSLQMRQRWGGFKKHVVDPVKKHVVKPFVKHVVEPAVKHARKAVTAVGHAVKTVVKHVGNAAKAVGKGLVEAGKFVGNAIVTAAKKTWEGIKAAAVFVAKLACKAVAGFLDTVVKGAVRGMMEMGKWAVYAGGKLVAAVLKNAFNIQLIQYTASIQGLIRANLGKFRVKAIVLGIKLDFELELALLRWAGIGEEADIQEGSERHLEAIPGEVIVRPQEDVAAEPEPHGYLMTEQMDEALAYSMAGHNVNDFMPTGGVLLGSQPSRRLLTADDSVNLHDEQVQDVQGRSEETGTAEWGGGRRRRSWIGLLPPCLWWRGR